MNQKEYPIIPADRWDDLHGLENIDRADLVLFMAGNQFMVMDEIVSEFQKIHPEIKYIYYETLPPGLELKQILAGGAMFKNKLIDVYPDIYTSVNEKGMQILQQEGHIKQNDYILYLHNRLVLMIADGNPAKISSVTDLGKDHVRVSQPDPENEDIAFHIMDMYRDAGGDDLVHRIMEAKKAGGSTMYTMVHHRETPERLLKRTVDVGPVWVTEFIHAKSLGHAFEIVEPGEDMDQRDRINYYLCQPIRAPHPEQAKKFIQFITSPMARKIYQKYGFAPHTIE